MATSPVIAAFPRRPLELSDKPGRRRRRLLSLGCVLLLFLPGVWFGWGVVSDMRLRADLRERGVETDVLSSDGRCTSRRGITGDSPIGCNLTITYQPSAEHGGGTRSADVWLHGSAPRVYAPAAVYDPENPDRAMLKPEVERDPGWDNLLGPFAPMLIGFMGLGIWIALGDGGLAKAGRDPRPQLVRIDRALRTQQNRLHVWFEAPGRPKPVGETFEPGNGPLLTGPPPGEPANRDWALALVPEKGRPYLVDAKLARFDFTEEERGAILRAAFGESRA
jgi:hypothetical protein